MAFKQKLKEKIDIFAHIKKKNMGLPWWSSG